MKFDLGMIVCFTRIVRIAYILGSWLFYNFNKRYQDIAGKQFADEGFRIKERNLHIYTSSFQGINESMEPD